MKKLLIMVFMTIPILLKAGPDGYTFVFNFRNEILVVKENEPNKHKAFENAAMECADYFTQGLAINEEMALDLIDTCANPKGF